ncbi:uncharacterized protein LOC127621407 isoform X2 [Xyrauchen texanus]|uniref:uncharacterized protein LOC127621407 isoform X2 n=1 Tax=Xyrauchen texanus TaxID=154827 RepID=UPI002241ECF9|nr:uncharacterized protein LOC127621407 isoform X2 [Xyrauchen texanus]
MENNISHGEERLSLLNGPLLDPTLKEPLQSDALRKPLLLKSSRVCWRVCVWHSSPPWRSLNLTCSSCSIETARIQTEVRRGAQSWCRSVGCWSWSIMAGVGWRSLMCWFWSMRPGGSGTVMARGAITGGSFRQTSRDKLSEGLSLPGNVELKMMRHAAVSTVFQFQYVLSCPMAGDGQIS